MKIDFSRVLWNEKGNALLTEDKMLITLGFAVLGALKTQYNPEFDKPLAGESYRRGKLAHKIAGEGEVEVDGAELETMKKLCDLRWPPLMAYAACELLDGKEGVRPLIPESNGRPEIAHVGLAAKA